MPAACVHPSTRSSVGSLGPLLGVAALHWLGSTFVFVGAALYTVSESDERKQQQHLLLLQKQTQQQQSEQPQQLPQEPGLQAQLQKSKKEQ